MDRVADPDRWCDECHGWRGMIVAAVENSVADEWRAALVLVPGQAELAERVKEALIARGERAIVVDDALISADSLVGVVRALQLAGVVAISARVLNAAVLAEIEGFAERWSGDG